MKADLHIHTNVSDSSYSIEETVKTALKNGVTHLGIVDHDTVSGVKRALEEGCRYGIQIIPGVEISAFSYEKDKKVHILGYNYRPDAQNITKICSSILEKRTWLSLWQLQQLKDNGYKITIDEVLEKARNSTAVYKQHIMDVLVEKGYAHSIRSKLYYKLFKNDGICNGSIEYIDVFKAVEAVKKDQGLAILAHPGQLDSYDLVGELVEAGLDGIEINHHDHTDRDIQKIHKIRNRYNLLLTGGSDFHGRYGINIDIGGITAPADYMEYFCRDLKVNIK